MPNNLNRNRRPARPGRENRNRHQRRNPRLQDVSRSTSSSHSNGGGHGPDSMSSFSFDAPLTDANYEAQKAQYNAEELALKNNAADAKAANDAIYGGMLNQMKPLTPEYLGQNQQIAGNLQANLNAFAPAYGLGAQSSVPSPDGGNYAGQVYGSIGASTLGLLANDASRVAAYGNSAQRQGSIEQMESQRGSEKQLTDRLNELAMQRAGLKPDLNGLQGEAWDRNMQARQLADDERQAAFERRQTVQANKSDTAYNRALAKMLEEQNAKKDGPKKKGRPTRLGKDGPTKPHTAIAQTVGGGIGTGLGIIGDALSGIKIGGHGKKLADTKEYMRSHRDDAAASRSKARIAQAESGQGIWSTTTGGSSPQTHSGIPAIRSGIADHDAVIKFVTSQVQAGQTPGAIATMLWANGTLKGIGATPVGSYDELLAAVTNLSNSYR